MCTLLPKMVPNSSWWCYFGPYTPDREGEGREKEGKLISRHENSIKYLEATTNKTSLAVLFLSETTQICDIIGCIKLQGKMKLLFAFHCANTDMVQAYISLPLSQMTFQLYMDKHQNERCRYLLIYLPYFYDGKKKDSTDKSEPFSMLFFNLLYLLL